MSTYNTLLLQGPSA